MSDDIASMLRASADRNERAAATYELLKAAEQLSRHRLISYRCDHARPGRSGCLLLDFIRTPDQIIVHQPSYKHSPEWFAEKWNDAGREKNSDGHGRSLPHTYDSTSALNFSAQCDHIAVVIESGDVDEDLRIGRRVVTVSSDGNRYA